MAVKNSKFNLDETDFIETTQKNDKPKKEVKFCAKCGTKSDLSSMFCFECGNNVFFNTYEEYENKINSKYCVNCKNKVDVKIKFCPNCGKKDFVSSKEELDDIYINLRIKDWEDKINISLNELEKLEKEKELLNIKNKELNSKYKRSCNELEKEFKTKTDKAILKTVDITETKKQLQNKIKDALELKEYKILELEEAEEITNKMKLNEQKQLENLTSDIKELEVQNVEMEKRLKNI